MRGSDLQSCTMPCHVLKLIILHQMTSYLCKPLSDLPNEEKVAPPENYTDLVNLLKDINEQSVKNDGITTANYEESKNNRNNILHMIQLIHKDGSKAPVAIILTPTDLTSSLTNKYSLQNLYENKQSQKDASVNQIKSSEKSNKRSENNTTNIAKETIDSKVENEETFPVVISTPEPDKNQTAYEINKEAIKSENALQYKLAYNRDASGLLITSTGQKNLQIATNKENFNNTIQEKGVKDEYYDEKLINNEPNVENEDNLQTVSLQLKENEDTTEYAASKKSSDDEVTKQSLTLESIQQNSNENSDDKNITQNIENSFDDDISVEKLLNKNNLKYENNKTGHPTIYYIDGDGIKEVNTECSKTRKMCFKENYCKLHKRTYNLSFVFNET